MAILQKYRNELSRITRAASTFFDVDIAVFDRESRLVSFTDAYLRQKGQLVHAPSIQEVMDHGKVLVNKPGHMEACIGCRFKGQCPATIEILRSIRIDGSPIGVVSFTSFSKHGHDRITRDTQLYVDAVDIFADWITDTVLNQENSQAVTSNARMLQSSLDLSSSALFTVDHLGAIVQCNQPTVELFSFCDLYTRSIYHILPPDLADKVLEGRSLTDIRVRINNSQSLVSALPAGGPDRFEGAVIAIRQSKSPSTRNRSRTLCADKITLDSLKGRSRAITKVRQQAGKMADSLSTILITGETGTGKGLLAKAIHSAGQRSKGPFVSVNCGSIPATLFESELFGYEEGAFSGARKGGKPGRLELAEGGTLLLDEIGEMELHLQVKLLNVLQDSSLQRVGGVIPIPIDVRIIAATNQDIEELVREGKFRPDLYYRLNVIPINMPPLRARRDDIAILADEFLMEYNEKLHKNITSLSPGLRTLLLDHNWPGNIRELQNIIEYSVNMEESDILTVHSLPNRFLDNRVAVERRTAQQGGQTRSLEISPEHAAILAALERHGWSVQGKSAAAEELGMSSRTLYRRLKQISSKDITLLRPPTFHSL
jgi:transcriptional regulator with PAS, ATPase and Fis domain